MEVNGMDTTADKNTKEKLHSYNCIYISWTPLFILTLCTLCNALNFKIVPFYSHAAFFTFNGHILVPTSALYDIFYCLGSSLKEFIAVSLPQTMPVMFFLLLFAFNLSASEVSG